MADTIKSQNYFDAANALFGVASALAKAQSSLSEELAGTDGMAGDDERGKEFGSAYDEQADSIESFGRDLARAIQNYGRVLRQAGINHATAETDSNINGAAPAAPPADPGELIAPCLVIPKASGGNSDGLEETIGLLEKVGIPVPDGDTGKLEKAESAWSKIASGQSAGYVGKISAVAGKFDELNGDEVDIIVEDLQELDSLVQDYTSLAGSLKEACASHHEYLTELRSQLSDILSSLAIDLGITATIGVLSSLVSFGAGGAAATAKATATIAKYANKIRRVIQEVKNAKKLKKIGDIFKGSRASSKNEQLLRFLRMELQKAKTQGAKNNIRGRIGEAKAGIDPEAPKTAIDVNGRIRIPDKIDEVANELTEVKNVNSIGKTKQIQDMLDYARQEGYAMRLVVDSRTTISGPLQELVDKGQITLVRLALS